MRLADIERRVAEITADSETDRDDSAHIKEDQLMVDFIQHIAKRQDGIGRMAAVVLETRSLGFDRWHS